MRLRSLAASAGLGLLVLLVQTATSKAAEIKLLCAIALQQLMENLGPKFETATKHKLTTTIAPIGQALKRLQDGEVYDVVILHVASSATAIVVTRIGLAVRKGLSACNTAAGAANSAERSLDWDGPSFMQAHEPCWSRIGRFTRKLPSS